MILLCFVRQEVRGEGLVDWFPVAFSWPALEPLARHHHDYRSDE